MESLEYIEHSKAKLMDLTGRQRFMLTTMLMALVLSIYGMYVLFYKQGLINEAMAGDDSRASEFDEMDKLNMISILTMLVGVTNIVAVCMFIYAVAHNAFSYYQGAMSHTPAMTVAWFFIPVAHIFMPFKALKDASKASNAMIEGKSAAEVAHVPAHKSMVVWGILWSVQMALMYIMMAWTFSSFGELKEADPSEQQIIIFQKTFYIQVVASVISFIGGIAFLIFSSKITKEQSAFRAS